jgi:hypothetical protein
MIGCLRRAQWVLRVFGFSQKRLKFLSNSDPRAYEKGHLLVMAYPQTAALGMYTLSLIDLPAS